MIRGNQMASFLNGRLRPKSGYENDVCVYIKYVPPVTVAGKTIIDIADGIMLGEIRDNVYPAVITTVAKNFMENSIKRDVILLPQHHCNFERVKRDRDTSRTAGIIGSPAVYHGSLEQLWYQLKLMRIRLIHIRNPMSRETVCNFFKMIDVQISFRPQLINDRRYLTTPLKLANAGSFGIPTITFPELSYVDEFNGLFLPIKSRRELISTVWRLKKDKILYQDLSQKLLERSEKYHIENIAKYYYELESL